MNSKYINWAREVAELVISICLALTAGLLGSYFTFPSIGTWYNTLTLPAWQPPSWLFGPVWTTLYILMAISAYIVWRHLWLRKEQNRKEIRNGLGLYLSQLLINAQRSVVFFGMQRVDLAFVVIVILWILIICTMLAFSKVSKTAVWLLVPYLMWVTFAMILNATIWALNGACCIASLL